METPTALTCLSARQDVGPMTNDVPLVGRAAIVTGASSGLGRATTAALAHRGAGVVAAARRKELLDELVAELAEAPGRVLAVACDVGRAKDVDALVATAQRELGGVDALVNNAALDHRGPITELTVAQWDEVIAVDLSGAFYAARAVFPLMASRGGGTIVNVSSVAGRKGWAGAAAYCAAKFGLTGLTHAINAEGAEHDIRCCVLYPGGMDTDWMPGEHPESLAPSAVADIIAAMISQPPGVIVNELVVTPPGERGYP